MRTETKYAPQTLGEVVYPNKAVEIRLKAYGSGDLQGHVMLYGPNGTGKTSIARLLIESIGTKEASIDSKSLAELLALKDLQTYLMNVGVFASMTVSQKHFLLINEIDEVKKGLEKFWKALDACEEYVTAIATTNHPMEVNKSIRSRFDLVEISAVRAAAALPRIQYILKSEGLVMPDAQVLYYLKQIEHMGDMRKYLKKVDELLFLHRNGHAFPSWRLATAALKVI